MERIVLFILNKTEVLDQLLKELLDNGIKGGTIIESKGMAYELANQEEFAFFGSLRKLLNPERKTNCTLLLIIHDKQLEIVNECIKKIVGDLSEPNTGILASFPLDFVKGMKF